MKKLIVTPITGEIVYATVNDKKGIITGNKAYLTDEAVECVLNHFMHDKQFKDKGQFGYEWDLTKYRGKVSMIAFDDSYVLVKKDYLDKLSIKYNGDFKEHLKSFKGEV